MLGTTTIPPEKPFIETNNQEGSKEELASLGIEEENNTSAVRDPFERCVINLFLQR